MLRRTKDFRTVHDPGALGPRLFRLSFGFQAWGVRRVCTVLWGLFGLAGRAPRRPNPETSGSLKKTGSGFRVEGSGVRV